MVMLIVKGLILTVAISYGYTCLFRGYHGNEVSALQVILFAASTAAFITLQWL